VEGPAGSTRPNTHARYIPDATCSARQTEQYEETAKKRRDESESTLVRSLGCPASRLNSCKALFDMKLMEHVGHVQAKATLMPQNTFIKV
jgi:hypothetical protein